MQVLASGFQTFGEDYNVDRAKLNFTIKLKRPQGQYSIYQDHPEEKGNDKKDDKTPPPDPTPSHSRQRVSSFRFPVSKAFHIFPSLSLKTGNQKQETRNSDLAVESCP